MARTTAAAAAKAAGVSRASLSRARAEGRVSSDDDGRVDPAEVRRVVRGRKAKPVPANGTDATLAAARLRKETALANIREMEAAKMRAELLPAAEVLEGWQAAIGRSRARLLRIPYAVAPELRRAAPEGDHAIAAVLTREIHDALRELSDTKVDSFDDDEAPV